MEQMLNREKFLKNFATFCNRVELNESFLNSLSGCDVFSKYMPTVEVCYGFQLIRNIPNLFKYELIFNFLELA
jgi:hypothetical protein